MGGGEDPSQMRTVEITLDSYRPLTRYPFLSIQNSPRKRGHRTKTKDGYVVMETDGRGVFKQEYQVLLVNIKNNKKRLSIRF